MDRRDKIDLIADRLSKKGMPRHCGLCNRFTLCSKIRPEELCPWLKINRSILAKYKIPHA
jgi:hypothetical protein